MAEPFPTEAMARLGLGLVLLAGVAAFGDAASEGHPLDKVTKIIRERIFEMEGKMAKGMTEVQFCKQQLKEVAERATKQKKAIEAAAKKVQDLLNKKAAAPAAAPKPAPPKAAPKAAPKAVFAAAPVAAFAAAPVAAFAAAPVAAFAAAPVAAFAAAPVAAFAAAPVAAYAAAPVALIEETPAAGKKHARKHSHLQIKGFLAANDAALKADSKVQKESDEVVFARYALKDQEKALENLKREALLLEKQCHSLEHGETYEERQAKRRNEMEALRKVFEMLGGEGKQ